MKKHRRSHRHSPLYRMKRWLRKNRTLFLCSTGIICLVLGATCLWMYQVQKHQKSLQITAQNSVNVGNGYRNITYQGKNYQYNSLITTILYAGVDSEGKLDSDVTYSNKERADSISLVILDEKNKKMTIMALSRDTMTEIRRYTRNGKDMGTYVSHLGYAYSYGDGGEASCENLKEAVSNLLGGIPIDEYAVTNQSSMTYLNNLVGGVTVTVPNNDLAELYPELTEGAVVKLDDTNVRDYLHYRDTSVSFSNEGRVERQQTYVTAYINQLKTQLTTDLEGSWQHLQEMDDYLLTSITKSQYIAMANLLETVSFTDSDYYRPTGENKEGELHDEFYLDEDAFQQKIIELFYEER